MVANSFSPSTRVGATAGTTFPLPSIVLERTVHMFGPSRVVLQLAVVDWAQMVPPIWIELIQIRHFRSCVGGYLL